MKGTKPRSVWQWLLLLTPALDLMFMPLVADRWGPFLFRHSELPELALLIYNLFLALSLSMVLGVWHAWDCPRWPERIATGLAFGIAIAVVNGTVAFAGCAIANPIFRVL